MLRKVLTAFLLPLGLLCFSPAKANLTSAEEAPAIHFLVDEDYLAAYTIARTSAHGPHAEDVNAFRKIAEKNHSLVVAYARNIYRDHGNQGLFHAAKSRFRGAVRSLKRTPEFQRILEQTQHYATESEAEWKRNLPRTLALMKQATLLPFKKETTVYLTHPAIGNGSAWNQEKRQISFGAHPAWENYFTVYIWHELMHFELPYNDGSHSLLQLLTDCWLREQLNGMPYPPFEGHEGLFPQMQWMLPAWLLYLRSPDGILNFYARLPEAEKR